MPNLRLDYEFRTGDPRIDQDATKGTPAANGPVS
jgi:hypothetical protein